MSKITWSNFFGISGIRVDPPPSRFSKFPHFPVYFFKNTLCISINPYQKISKRIIFLRSNCYATTGKVMVTRSPRPAVMTSPATTGPTPRGRNSILNRHSRDQILFFAMVVIVNNHLQEFRWARGRQDSKRTCWRWTTEVAQRGRSCPWETKIIIISIFYPYSNSDLSLKTWIFFIHLVIYIPCFSTACVFCLMF